jgi:hypothetical protein
MAAEPLAFGGIVVSDREWAAYRAATAGGREIRVRFDGDRRATRIWADGSGGLLCQRGGEAASAAPVYPYSEVQADPNTEAISESAVFVQRMVASGLPVELVLQLTNKIYATRPHDWPVPDALIGRILEKFRNGDYT